MQPWGDEIWQVAPQKQTSLSKLKMVKKLQDIIVLK